MGEWLSGEEVEKWDEEEDRYRYQGCALDVAGGGGITRRLGRLGDQPTFGK